mgnify:CR=1 FL=1
MINKVGDSLKTSLMHDHPNANVDKSERYVSLGTGAFIALKGIGNIFSHPLLAVSELAIGGALLYRGMTGYCPVKNMLENQTRSAQPEPEALAVTTSTTSAMGNATGAAYGAGSATEGSYEV